MVDLSKGATVELVKALSDDIRTLPNGTKAESAGAAVRWVYSKLENEIAAVGKLTINSWSGVQSIVREGIASKVFSIGDQLTCQRNGVNLVWDIIGIDHDIPADSQYTHSLTLQLHDCFPDQMQYDAPEAFYYASAEMAAGTYHFTVGSTDYQFTLSSAVPAGGQLMLTYSGDTPSSVSVSTAKGGTAAGSIAVSAGNEGTELTSLNAVRRIRYGWNNYRNSAIRQWLNSSEAAGSVWTPQTDYDRPPAWAAGKAGFLNGMDRDFLDVVGTTAITVVKNRVSDGGGSETLNDQFFLLSRSEVYGSMEGGNDEGAPYPYYAEHSDLSEAGMGNDTNRMKAVNGSSRPVWLRTPEYGSEHWVRAVSGVNGSITTDSAEKSKGIAPACNII